MQIYVLIDNQPQGPYTPDEVRTYLKSGQLLPADLAAYAGSSDWQPLGVMMKSWGAAAPATAGARPAPDNSKKKRTLPLIISIVSVLLLAALSAFTVKFIHAHRKQPDIQGAWEGIVQMQGGRAGTSKVRVVLHVSAANGAYHATGDCIDMRQKDIPIDKFTYDYPLVDIENKDTGNFKATLNATADEMSGTWQQAGQTMTVTLKRTATPDTIPDLLTDSDYAPRTGSDLQGYWKGTLKAGSISLRLAFKIAEPTDGQYVAEVDSLDQGANHLVVSSFTYDRPKVRLEVGLVGGVYQGTVNNDGNEITGTWTQARTHMPLTMERTDLKVVKAEQAAAAQDEATKDYSHTGPDDLPGHWSGTLKVQGMELHLLLHIARQPDGGYSGALDSVDQGATGIPANFVRFTAPSLRMGWSTIGGTFDGKLQNGKITGKWRQGGQALAMVFERSE